jgi:CRP/FNR family transcriptional regulator
MDTLHSSSTSQDEPILCKNCEARHGGLCSALSSQELCELSRQSTRRHIEAGQELVGQGEKVPYYANILRGVVKLSKMMSDGRQQIVGLQFAPDFLGRPFQIESTMAAEAATDLEICVFPRASIDRMLSQSSTMERKLHGQSLKELDEAREWMLTLGRKSALEKVASFLYLIADHIDPTTAAKSSFDLPLSRAEIADFLGLTIETVSRQMTKLRKDGLISIENNRHITVPNLASLRTAAGLE